MYRTAVVVALVLTLCSSAAASDTIFYGTRVGMEVTVVGKSGIGTAHAVIRTRHTRKNAVTFCREYVGYVTRKCIRNELAVPLANRIEANCKSGTFTDFEGNRHRLIGRNPNKQSMTRYHLMDMKTHRIADGSMASGYPTDMRIFAALCPAIAPKPY